MIDMSYLATMISGFDGVGAEYEPSRLYAGEVLPAVVRVTLNNVSDGRATMTLTVEDARALADQLPQILMLHDAAVRLAAEKAVA